MILKCGRCSKKNEYTIRSMNNRLCNSQNQFSWKLYENEENLAEGNRNFSM